MASNIGNSQEPHMLLSRLKACMEEMNACVGLITEAELDLKSRVHTVKSDIKSFITQLIVHLNETLETANDSVNDFSTTELTDLKQKSELVHSYMKTCAAASHDVDGLDTRIACKTVEKAEMLAENIRNNSKYDWLKFIAHIQSDISFEDIGFVRFCPLDPDQFDIFLSSVMDVDMERGGDASVVLYSNIATMALLHSNQPYVPQAARYISCRLTDGAEGEDISMRLEDSKDGSYFIHFTPRSIGVLSLSVRVFGVEVKDSPVRISVIPGSQPSSVILSPRDGTRVAHEERSVGQPSPQKSKKSQRSANCGWVDDDDAVSIQETFRPSVSSAPSGVTTDRDGSHLSSGYRPAGAIVPSKYPRFREPMKKSCETSSGCETTSNEAWGSGSNAPAKSGNEAWGAGSSAPVKTEAEAWGSGSSAPVKIEAEAWGAGSSAPVKTEAEAWGAGSNAPAKTSSTEAWNGDAVSNVPVDMDCEEVTPVVAAVKQEVMEEVSVVDNSVAGDVKVESVKVKMEEMRIEPETEQIEIHADVDDHLLASPRDGEEVPPVLVVGGTHVRESVLQQYIDKKITKVKTKFVTSIGRPGTGPDSLHMPIGVTINSVNDVIICDTRHNLVKIFSMSGKCRETIHKAGATEFARPSAVVVNIFDEIYVKDDRAVHVFDASGVQYFHSIGENIVKRPYGLFLHHSHVRLMRDPGLAFNSEDHLMLYDECRPQPKLYEFTMEAELVRESLFQPLLESKANFNSKCRFMTCSGEHVYVVDLGRSVIYKTTFAGTAEKVFGRLGRELGEFNEPSGISADSHGNLLIADSRNNRIQLFNNEAQACGVVELANEIIRPSDIHLTDTGILLVSNYLKHCIKIFQIEPPPA